MQVSENEQVKGQDDRQDGESDFESMAIGKSQTFNVAAFTFIGAGLSDYVELDVDHQGVTHIVWGEGLNYNSPGSIWYSRGR